VQVPERFSLFRQLHHERVLVLPNAWDAATALSIEGAGASAIATTSAGVAWSHGYPDGDALPVRLLLATVDAITRTVRVPVTVDIEGGYAADPVAVGQAVAAVIEAGAVGINIEDGIGSPDLLCSKIRAAKDVAATLGADLFVNARTDVYLRNLSEPRHQADETISRAELYRSAGADGIFVPGLTAVDDIRSVVASVGLPLNVLATPGLPPLPVLETCGVRRLSAGSSVALAALGQIATWVAAFVQDGSSDIFAGAPTYSSINTSIGKRQPGIARGSPRS
jgi:2-methylisocitrate lyase-like PEP mutase family enzyme